MEQCKNNDIMRDPGIYCPPHINPELEAVYVKKGTLTVRYDDQELVLRSGEMTLLLPYHVHAFLPEAGVDAVVYLFPRTVFGTFTQTISGSSRMYSVCSVEQHAAQYIGHLEGKMRTEQTPTRLNCLFGIFAEQFLSGAATEYSPSGELFPTEMYSFLYDHLEEHLSVGEIARHIGWEKRRLSSTFLKRHGIKLTQLISNMRAQRAMELLETSQLSVTDIAIACGFNSLRSFNRILRGYLGKSPSDYRKSLRNTDGDG